VQSSAIQLLPDADSFARGLDYLYQVRKQVLDPELIDVVHNLSDRIPICTWIGTHIERVNAELAACLQACQACFHAWEQRSVQIFAAPLARSFGLDGVCNIQTSPITILVDVGRVVPEDWLAIVAHEYAHAHLGSPGHHQDFARVLTHLCLGLGLEPPAAWQPDMEIRLRSCPPCRSTPDPLAFWMGKTSDTVGFCKG
jgi:hypothetical protein